MKKYLLIVLLYLTTQFLYAGELYHVSSKNMDIKAFDVTITEIKRNKFSSLLKIPGFHDRSAPASRWMMCAYTDLAVKRKFSYWTAFYPETGNDELLLVFPTSESPNDPVYKGMDINPKELFVTSVSNFARFCGIKVGAP